MSLLVESLKLLNLKSPVVNCVRNAIRLPSQPYKRVRPAPRPVFVEKPKPGNGSAFRRIVHFEEEYTIKPLEVTNLAGRDPISGRVVAKGIGGGIKQKYHDILWHRDGPEDGPPLEEKVIQVMKCGCRTANIALVASGDKLKYILATVNMKAGDVIKSSKHIPRIPVRPNEGDSYPLGALPIGTLVHNVQLSLNSYYSVVHAAGTYATIKKHIAGRIVIQLPSKEEWSINPKCIATVGRLSNIDHGSTPIGSAQRNRELGNRPRSGLWQRKTGRHGRKIRALPPLKHLDLLDTSKPEYIRLTHPSIHI